MSRAVRLEIRGGLLFLTVIQTIHQTALLFWKYCGSHSVVVATPLLFTEWDLLTLAVLTLSGDVHSCNYADQLVKIGSCCELFVRTGSSFAFFYFLHLIDISIHY